MIIRSIFQSIDGEVSWFHQGRVSTFIRLAGCNFFKEGGCSYCDTKYAQDPESGEFKTIEDVVQSVIQWECPKVTITGGEPLAQPETPLLILSLLRLGFMVSVETNGSLPIPESIGPSGNPLWLLKNLCWIMDYKLLGSGMEHKMEFVNFLCLGERDFVKFVVNGGEDIHYACYVREQLIRLGCKATFAFSPVAGKVDPAFLVEEMKKRKLTNCIFSYQIHKLLWPNIDASKEER